MINVVVIASYGCEENVENLILSLLNQKNTKLIFIDNACKKSGSDILKFYSQKHKIPLIRNNNYSIRLSKDKGVQASKEDYICFISGNDTVKDGFFEEVFDENYDITIPGKEDCDIFIKDFVNEEISSTFYGKVIRKNILPSKTPLNLDEKETFYKFDDKIKMHLKKTDKYKHVGKLFLRKEFTADYNEYSFFYDQYKYFTKNDELRKIATEKMIKYGNIAYAKMITDKDKYKIELSNIKNCYVCLKDDCGAKYDKKVFNKIKDGKFTEGDLNTQKFILIKKVSKKLNDIANDIKPEKKKAKKKVKIKK